MRRHVAVLAFLGWLAAVPCVAASAAAAASGAQPFAASSPGNSAINKIRIVSLKKYFLSWSAEASKSDRAQWSRLFEQGVIAGNSDYYNGLVFDDERSKEKRAERLEENTGGYYKNRKKMAEAFDYVEENLLHLSGRFYKTFPDMKAGITLIVMPSLGRFNGKEQNIKGEPCAGFGVEYFIKDRSFLGLGREKTLPIAAAHEMFHLYHGSKTGMWETAEKPVLIWIWIDGLATYASRILNPGTDDADALMDSQMAKICEASYKSYTKELLPIMRSKKTDDQNALFDFGKRYGALPTRAGYCIGLKAVESLSKKHSLTEMSGWTEAEAAGELTALFKRW